MLTALIQKDEMAASELAEVSGISAQTASGHLFRLTKAGLLRVRRNGRFRHYRLASADTAALIETIYVCGSRIVRRHQAVSVACTQLLKACRQCRGHMAGMLGTELAGLLLTNAATVSKDGMRILSLWGLPGCGRFHAVRIPRCCDWSEPSAHISGELGRALLDRSLMLGWIRPRAGSQVLEVTNSGLRGFHSRFGIPLSNLAQNSDD
ncbi:transcriptional regulator [Sphingomonas koreensis]|nr:transcriptional regulator [Sphingomonas koreensis]